MLTDHVDQRFALGKLPQIGFNRFVEARGFFDVDGIFQKPRQKCFGNVLQIVKIVEKERVFNAVQHVHIFHDAPDFLHDALNLRPLIGKLREEQISIFAQALAPGKLCPAVGDTD
ncbi:hypothetical protein SDC9_62170 [bioreactor metagenome]|uniref:Uncharacterized protein n=1 Tax=bioreactor metagenome TaxID=1076179 RepID=A0A644XJ15_9ZZZZ